MRNALATLALLASPLSGCTPQDLDWEIRFEPSALSSTAVRLDARILKGPCPGTEVLWDQTVHPGGRADAPPELPEGTYCFGARAGDASCQWFAAGTTEAILPRDGPIVVVVRAQTPVSNCAAMCVAGVCGGGGTDGGAVDDCPEGRCTRDCVTGDTCAHRCSGGACDLSCGTAGECAFSCDGGGCNIACGTGADCSATCAGGGCTIDCGTSANCSATCANGGCTMACSTGAQCDFDCVGGRCAFSCGSTADRCTTTCPPGDCTGG